MLWTAALQSTQPLTGDGGGGDAVQEVTEGMTESLEQVQTGFSRFLEDPSLDSAARAFGPLVVDLGQALLGFLVLVVVVMFVARWVQKLARLALERIGLEVTLIELFSRFLKYGTWLLAVPIALEIFGVTATSLAAVVGAAGLAVGLAMQGALSNVAAGMMLLLLRPFKLGDWVELDGEFGEVRAIGVFYTELTTFSNKLVTIPNSRVLDARIENVTSFETRRIEVPVGVAYGTDLPRAREVIQSAIDGIEGRVEEPASTVLAIGFGDSAIDLEARLWCESRSFLDVRTRAVLAIERALDEAGIVIPFPQRTVHLRRASEEPSAGDDVDADRAPARDAPPEAELDSEADADDAGPGVEG